MEDIINHHQEQQRYASSSDVPLETPEQMQQRLHAFDVLLAQNQAQLRQAQVDLHATQAEVHRLSTASNSTPATFSVNEPKLQIPSSFSGRKSDACEFLMKCETVFGLAPNSFPNDKIKIGVVSTSLKDEAYRWYWAGYKHKPQPAWVNNWELFKAEFEILFFNANVEEKAYNKIRTLRQTGSTSSYAVEFKNWAGYLEATDQSLQHDFFAGLKTKVQNRLLSSTQYSTLSSLIEAAIKWDDLLFQRNKLPNQSLELRDCIDQPGKNGKHNNGKSDKPLADCIGNKQGAQQHNSHTSTTTTSSSSTHTPMEIDGTGMFHSPLTPEEKADRRKKNLCAYCGLAGHTTADCRACQSSRNNRNKTISATSTDNSTSKNQGAQG